MKTSELTGAALDWAVAKCEGVEVHIVDGEIVWRDELRYSTDWADGGPIIEREKIEVFIEDEQWKAYSSNSLPKNFDGETPLVAAMRCFVASVLGDEVEIPEKLT